MAKHLQLQWDLHCEHGLLFNTKCPEKIQGLKLGSQKSKTFRSSLCPIPMHYNGEKATLHLPSKECSEKLSPQIYEALQYHHNKVIVGYLQRSV